MPNNVYTIQEMLDNEYYRVKDIQNSIEYQKVCTHDLSVYYWIKSGKLPAVKPFGGKVYFIKGVHIKNLFKGKI